MAVDPMESHCRPLLESDRVGVAFWDEGNVITEANTTFLEIVGYSPQDLRAGKLRWNVMAPPNSPHPDRKALEEMQTSGVAGPYVTEVVRSDTTLLAQRSLFPC